ncbi:MAG: hypothetical protein EBR09_12600 [Proteobacteria bacterium]|nr:hypothetical protein [Pseudomonadota bacterium]
MKILFAITLVSTVASAQALAAKCGDVNQDGVVGGLDASIIGEFAKGKAKLIGTKKNLADVNLDGRIDETDSKLILGFDAGLVKCLPCPANQNACKTKDAPKCGDLNGDGIVGGLDASIIGEFAKGKAKLIGTQKNLADVNLDGRIDETDSKLVLSFDAGLVKCLSCPANRNACKSP